MCVKVTITKEYEVKFCNKNCPFCIEVEDTSVCEDSFDEPNYDWYCAHKDADNSGHDVEKYNDKNGKYIGGSLSRFGSVLVPKWCPFKKK